MSLPEPICKIEMWSFVCNDDSHQHYLWIWKDRHFSYIALMRFVSFQTSTPMRVVRPVCVEKYFFFLNKNPSLTWSGRQNLLLYSSAANLWLAIPWEFYDGQNLSNDYNTSTWNGILFFILQPFVAPLARDAAHAPLVWLILSCPVMLLVGVMMMLFRHWKMLMLIYAKQNFRFV